jgi:hypothetical protein
MSVQTTQAPARDAAAASDALPEEDELVELLLRSMSRFETVSDDVRLLARIRSEHVKLRLRKAIVRAQWVVVGFLTVLLLLVAGIIVLAIGTERAFTALFAEQPWLGHLAAGITLIGAAIGLISAAQALSRRSHARELERKYADS